MIEARRFGMGLMITATVVFLCISVGLYFIKENESDKRIVLEERLSDAEDENIALRRKVDGIEKENTELDLQLRDALAEAKAIERDLAAEKTAVAKLEAEMGEKQAQLDEIAQAVGREKEEKLMLAQKLAGAQRLYEELNVRLDELDERRGSLKKQLSDFSKTRQGEVSVVQDEVELPKIVIDAERKVGGEVLVVNKDFNFVVINVGQEHGLKVGSIVTFYRDDNSLGQAEVAKIYSQMAAANLLNDLKGRDIKEGDRAEVMLED